MTEIITAHAREFDNVFAPGERVAVMRRTEVGHSGTAQDWFIDRADRAADGPLGPAWGDPAGHSVQWHGWGTGWVVTAGTGAARTYTVELDPGAADLVEALNAYEGDGEDIWGDVILDHPAYDPEATEEVDTGDGKRIVTTDGSTIEYGHGSHGGSGHSPHAPGWHIR